MPSRDALAKQVQRFLDHLAVERGLSPHTVAAYRRDLGRYAAFLRERGRTDVRTIDERTVTAYVAAVSASRHGEGKPYRATSVVRSLSCVRAFHRFLLREGVVTRDPTAGVVRPKLPRSLPRPLSVDDVGRLLAHPHRSASGLRDRAVLETLYGAGLRVLELVARTSTTST
jgi:integrase/recombinase XerD